MALSLPKQSFLALAAIGWADGSFRKTEVAALLAAAQKAGLIDDDLADIERSTKKAVTIDAFEPGNMSEWDRVVTYALASWVAIVDGVQSRDESTVLRALGERLGLSEAIRQRAASAAFDVAVLPESANAKTERFDFDKLQARLHERMPQLG